jgi:glutaredoxin
MTAPQPDPPPRIEIFHAQLCGLCHEAMDYFTRRGLPFTAHEVFWDAAHDRWVDDANSRQLRERAGAVDFVPQIFINGHHIRGWRELEPMIASGELEAWLRRPPAP